MTSEQPAMGVLHADYKLLILPAERQSYIGLIEVALLVEMRLHSMPVQSTKVI